MLALLVAVAVSVFHGIALAKSGAPHTYDHRKTRAITDLLRLVYNRVGVGCALNPGMGS